MAKFKKKPLEYEAIQWFKNGDHPQDAHQMLTGEDGKLFLSEGKFVRYFRDPNTPGEKVCHKCRRTMNGHGWIDLGSHGINVCPGNWIVTELSGELRAVYGAAQFAFEFEPVGA